MNLLTKLQDIWETRQFASTWLIQTNDFDASLRAVKNFSQEILQAPNNLEIDNNPDFAIIEREENSQKNLSRFITIAQIRDSIAFLNRSSAISKCKIIVINGAEFMNESAMNCCLKIFEEPPANCYIFLLAKTTISIPLTIKSRCRKLQDYNKVVTQENELYNSIKAALDKKDSSYIESFVNKTSLHSGENWNNFSQAAIDAAINKLKSVAIGNIEEVNTDLIMIQSEQAIKAIKETTTHELDKKQAILRYFEAMS